MFDLLGNLYLKLRTYYSRGTKNEAPISVEIHQLKQIITVARYPLPQPTLLHFS